MTTIVKAGRVPLGLERLASQPTRPPATGRTAIVTPRLDATPATPCQDRIPARLAQQTAPEIHAAAQAAADGVTGRHWRHSEGELVMIHDGGERSQHSVRLVGEPMLDLLRLPLTMEVLKDEVRHLGGLQGVVQLHVMISTALASPRANVAFAIDDLIHALGLDPRTTAERQRERQRVWARVLLLEHLQVIGERRGKYKDRTTGAIIDTTFHEALIRVTRRDDEAQQSFDPLHPPLVVHYVLGPTLESWKANPHILHYAGDVLRLAAIPARQPSGAWAQSIGLALQQLWRQDAARATVRRAGEDKHQTLVFPRGWTRRELLELYPPDPTVDEVLNNSNPQRVITYFDAALKLLERHGVISKPKLPPKPTDRKGRAEAYLAQTLDLRPKGEDIVALATIADGGRKARAKRGRKRSAS